MFDFEVSDLLKKNLHTPSEFSHFPQKKKIIGREKIWIHLWEEIESKRLWGEKISTHLHPLEKKIGFLHIPRAEIENEFQISQRIALAKCESSCILDVAGH